MSEGDYDGIELLCLTGLWRFPRYIYRILDRGIDPINLRLVMWVFGVFPLVTLVLSQTPIGFTTWGGLGLLPHVMLPLAVVYWGLTLVGHGAKPHELAWSWLRLTWAYRPARRPASGVRLRSRARIRETA